MQALNDNVLILARSTDDEIRDSGLIVPGRVAATQESGEVWLAGPEAKGITPGDYVYFQPHQIKSALKIGSKRVLAVKAVFICAVEKKAINVEDAKAEML